MITTNIRDFLLTALTNNNMPLLGLNMCELGNQIWFDGGSAKIIFNKLGVNHVSLDWNGQDGSVPVDLRVPIARSLWGRFDIVTDLGCSEHIENPYEVNRNIHRLARVGGLIIRTVPFSGTWPGHCPFRYKVDAFDKLSRSCSYELQINEKRPCGGGWPDPLLYGVMTKTLDEDFITIDEFNGLDIIDFEPRPVANGHIPVAPSVPASGNSTRERYAHFAPVITNNLSGISYKYRDIPFEVNRTFIMVNESRQKDMLGLAGISAKAIHMLEFAENSLSIPNDVQIGLIKVYYMDGTYEQLDLKMGFNIAEWAYDRPEVQKGLRHNKAVPAYSWSTMLDSKVQYYGHGFYVKVNTDRGRPLDRIELIICRNAQNDSSLPAIAIKAVTLEM
jgi:hypothetical protein